MRFWSFFAVKKLADDPQKAWQRFVLGLPVFFIGLFILLGFGGETLAVNAIGIVVMLIGFVVAMTGYLAIFISRFRFKK